MVTSQKILYTNAAILGGSTVAWSHQYKCLTNHMLVSAVHHDLSPHFYSIK